MELYEYQVAGHFCPALINSDSSGLSDEECAQLEQFERVAHETASADGFCNGHIWDITEEYPHFRTCDVCRLEANCYDVRLVCW